MTDPASVTTPETAPDYTGGGIANLVSSLLQGRGGSTPLPAAQALAPERVREFRTVVLLVLDGLGYEFLAARPDSYLHRHLRARLTSVFPSTTASAITTYLSGLTPLEHGLTGWFTYLRELGSVATVLPFRPRNSAVGYARMGVEPRRIFHWTPLFDRMQAQGFVISPAYIVDSEYSRATAGGARRLGYRDLEEFAEHIRRVAADGTRRNYVYAYWPELDAVCHREGASSDAAEEHFRDLDRIIERLHRQLHGSDTLLVVCADHGHIDTCPERTVHLDDHPTLAAALTLPLCGEPRAAYCYVAPEKADGFERYVRERLAHQCRLVRRTELLSCGWLGPGTPHTFLESRVGDYLLLMRDNWVIRDRLLGEEPTVQIGVHGGVSTAEMFVPLVVL